MTAAAVADMDLGALRQRAQGLRLNVGRLVRQIERATAARDDRKVELGHDSAGEDARRVIDRDAGGGIAALQRQKADAETALAQCERDIEEAQKEPGRRRRAEAAAEVANLVRLHGEQVREVDEALMAAAGKIAALHTVERELARFMLDDKAPRVLDAPGLRRRLESCFWLYLRQWITFTPTTVGEVPDGGANVPFAERCRRMMENLEFIPRKH